MLFVNSLKNFLMEIKHLIFYRKNFEQLNLNKKKIKRINFFLLVKKENNLK